MSEILAFMGEHPLLTFFLAVLVFEFFRLPFRLANRVIRHKNIAAQGWPPAHCDADGDLRDEESAA